MRISEIQRPVEALPENLYRKIFSPKVDYERGSVCFYDAEVDDCTAEPEMSIIGSKLTKADFERGLPSHNK